MDHMEMVEKLRTKANVSYEEAKEALEKNDWDILDALVMLEGDGKVKGEEPAPEYTTQETNKGFYVKTDAREAKEGLSKLWDWIKRMVKKGNSNQFVITRRNEELISMPITVMALLLICFWPFSLILLFVALFLGARYSFRGPDVSSKVNDMVDKAQEKAASVVEIHTDGKNENNGGSRE